MQFRRVNRIRFHIRFDLIARHWLLPIRVLCSPRTSAGNYTPVQDNSATRETGTARQGGKVRLPESRRMLHRGCVASLRRKAISALLFNRLRDLRVFPARTFCHCAPELPYAAVLSTGRCDPTRDADGLGVHPTRDRSMEELNYGHGNTSGLRRQPVSCELLLQEIAERTRRQPTRNSGDAKSRAQSEAREAKESH